MSLLITAIFIIIPLAVVILASLQPFWIGSIVGVSLNNYLTVLGDAYFIDSFMNSLIISTLTLASLPPIAFVISYLVNRTLIAERKAIELIANIPTATPQ